MAMRSRDLTLDLDDKRIAILTWSSDPQTYTVSNKIINTTLDNTVQDLKEVISERSYHEGGNINPLALQLRYRAAELRSSDPLSTVFENELQHVLTSTDPIRVQVEFDKSKLMAKEVKPCLLNVNLCTSSGKVVRLRESMHTTIQSLKYTLVDDLHLTNGLSEITGLHFNGNVDVCDQSDATIGTLLKLDTVPFGDLNFFVTLASDMKIRLASPNERILRNSEMSVNLDTTIFTVKKYILDQYSGRNPDVTTTDIKVIYFGRVLTDDVRIRNLTSPSSSESLTLHFVLQEPEEGGPSGGFWNDLRNGKLFEFYPKEPNPHFATESQRIERLREQFRNSGAADEPTMRDRAQGVLVQDYTASDRSTPRQPTPPAREPEAMPVRLPTPTPIQPTSMDEEPQVQPSNEASSSGGRRPGIPVAERRLLEEFLRTHRLPDGASRTGETYELIDVDGEQYLVDPTEDNETAFQITVQTITGPRSVTLSAEQLIINDSIPGKPYVMVTKSGYAKLRALGVEIAEPEIQVERPNPSPQTAPPFFMPNQQAGHQAGAPQHAQNPALQENGAAVADDRPPEGQLALGDRALDVIIRWAFHSFRYFIFYGIFVAPNLSGWIHHLGVAVLILSLLTTLISLQTVRNGLAAFGINVDNAHWGYDPVQMRQRLKNMIKRLVSIGRHRPGTNPLVGALRGLIVDIALFFTSASPPLHEFFLTSMAELENEERILRDTERARIMEALLDEQRRALNAEDVDETVIGDANQFASGVRQHTED